MDPAAETSLAKVLNQSPPELLPDAQSATKQPDFGLRVWGLGFGVKGFGFGVPGLELHKCGRESLTPGTSVSTFPWIHDLSLQFRNCPCPLTA